MVIYLQEAYDDHRARGVPMTDADLHAAVMEGAVQRLRPKLMTVTAVILSLAPILWETGIGSDVMKPIAAPIVGGMITSTIHVLILVPIFFLLIKRREVRSDRSKGNSVQLQTAPPHFASHLDHVHHRSEPETTAQPAHLTLDENA